MNDAGTIAGFNRNLAILVAIDRYGGGVPELQTPVADAEKLAEVLHRDHGFETQVVKNTDATFDKLKTLLADLPTRVGSDDRVLFYFAGHGIALESDDGPKGYILPQDADRSSDERYLPMVDLNKALSALPCRHMLVILDCCFAGALRWAGMRDLVLAPENLHQERYSWFIHDAAWQAIASAAHDQKALDVAAGQPLGARDQTSTHSPFAEALIEGLAGAADLHRADQPAGDGVITATELFLYLEDRLMPPPGSGRFRQTPLLWPLQKHDKGQFVFLVPGHDLNLPPAPPLNPAANPWLGLRTYEPAQSDLFYGRRSASDKLLERVLRDPLVVVTGPSGIGKSSLVRAGLLPRLDTRLIESIIIRPGPRPFAILARALSSASSAEIGSPDEQELKSNSLALAEWMNVQPGDHEILLVIDQAEELITMSHKDDVARSFVGLIAKALNADNKRLRVLMTVRSEFEPQFAQSVLEDRWPAARYLVPRMTQDELRRVIEGPATVKVMRFESNELVDQLVNEVVEMPGALPLLSFALSEMYASYIKRRSDDRTLSFEDYNALKGGVSGSLRVRANEVVDGVDEQHKDTARRVLERLVSVETGEFARRRVPRRELDAGDPAENARVGEILRRLDEARLIVTDKIDDERYLELAHDALILGWDRLLSWVREDVERITVLRRLTPDAETWDASAKKKSGLLWSDAARHASLKEMKAAKAPGLNRIENDFAIVSFQAARRNQVRLWSAITALILLTLAASWFGYNAVQQRDRAELNTAQAKANELAAKARASVPTRLDMSLAWAIRSLKKLQGYGLVSQEGEESLRNTLANTRGLRRFCLPESQDMYSDSTTSVAISPDNNLIAVGIFSGAVCFYRRHPDQRLELIETLQSFGDAVPDLHFSPDGKWLFSRTRGGYLRALDLTATVLNSESKKFSDNNYRFHTVGDNDIVRALTFNANARAFAFYNEKKGIVQVWKLDSFDPSGMATHTYSVSDDVVALHLDPTGTTLSALVRHIQGGPGKSSMSSTRYRIMDTIGGFTGQFKVKTWSLDTGQSHEFGPVLTDAHDYLDEQYRDTAVFQISPDGRLVAVGIKLNETHNVQSDFATELWQISPERDPTLLQRFSGRYINGNIDKFDRVAAFGITPDGARLYAARGSEIYLWPLADIRADSLPTTTLSVPQAAAGANRSLGIIYSLSISADSRYIAAGDSNGVLTVWDMSTLSGTIDEKSFFVEPRDPAIGAGGVAIFSSDSQWVALGGENGSMQLCQITSDCGSLDPKVVLAPREEGQWLSWAAAPRKTWIAAISESRQIHFKRPQSLERDFFSVELLDKLTRIPVASNEYVSTSGSPGRNVAVESSPSGAWAAAFEVDQYYRNTTLNLVKLEGLPTFTRIDAKKMGCNSFGGVAFDPQERLLVAFQGGLALDTPCATLIELPRNSELPANKIAPTRLSGYQGGLVEFSARGTYLINRSEKSATLWLRDERSHFDRLALTHDTNIRNIQIDPQEKWLVTTIRKNDEYNLIISTLDSIAKPGKSLGTGKENPTVVFDPRGQWLVVVTRAAGNTRLVRLWRLSSLLTPAAEWYLAMENVEVRIIFTPEGDKFVVGPNTFEIPSAGVHAATLPALVVDLRPRKPAGQSFTIPIESYQSGSMKIGAGWSKTFSNGLELTYQFSADGRWLATSNPGNLWFYGPDGLHRVQFFNAARPAFSLDSSWLVLQEREGIQLTQLTRSGHAVEHGNIAPGGSARFTSDSSGLLVLVNGEIRQYSLGTVKLLDVAANFMGRNLAWNEWSSLFPDEPYQKLFPDYPVDISYIDELLTQAKRSQQNGSGADAASALAIAACHAIEMKSVHAVMAVTKTGIRLGHADQVLPAADYLVSALPKSAMMRDWRGKARAAAGMTDGAIEDFVFVVTNTPGNGTRDLRSVWLGKLKKGQAIPLEDLVVGD